MLPKRFQSFKRFSHEFIGKIARHLISPRQEALHRPHDLSAQMMVLLEQMYRANRLIGGTVQCNQRKIGGLLLHLTLTFFDLRRYNLGIYGWLGGWPPLL